MPAPAALGWHGVRGQADRAGGRGVGPARAERLRVTAVDLRAHGKTDRVRERCDVEDLADDVDAVLDALGAGRVAVVGYSLGGMVGQALARRHPARAGGLGLGATAAQP